MLNFPLPSGNIGQIFVLKMAQSCDYAKIPYSMGVLALPLFHWLDLLILDRSKMAAKSMAQLKAIEFNLFAEYLR